MFTAMIAPEAMQINERFFGMRKPLSPTEEKEFTEALAADIYTRGLFNPIKVYVDANGIPQVFSGKRRFEAMLLIAQGFTHKEKSGAVKTFEPRKNYGYPVEVYSEQESKEVMHGFVMNLGHN